MPRLIWDFNKFMDHKFKWLALGLVPSGKLHLGFLTTLACGLMYLKEHPGSHLLITTIENTIPKRDMNLPMMFNYFSDDRFIAPTSYEEVKKRSSAAQRLNKELKDIIWKLIQAFDQTTKKEKLAVKKSAIPKKLKRLLEQREHSVFHFFGSHIYIFSFTKVLNSSLALQKQFMRYLTDPEFVQRISPTLGKIGPFDKGTLVGDKKYNPQAFRVPLKLFCPDCKYLTPFAKVVLGHPLYRKPTLVSVCENRDCPRGSDKNPNNRRVIQPMNDFSKVQFLFFVDPMRDFFEPFYADCHIFGGDYFQIYTEGGNNSVSVINNMFSYMEGKTGQHKTLFGGPLIMYKGEKMSKTGKAFYLSEVENVKNVFLNICSHLEDTRSKTFPKGLQIEYRKLLRKRR